jgi:hypothetical protein
MGCTGNALATGIDAPPHPKVSSFLKPVIGGGTGKALNLVPMFVELSNLARKQVGVKDFVWDGGG